MKKKIISALSAVTMLVSGGLTLSACNNTANQDKVMNVSLNPEVEFVLDENDKVVSANALNEEGNIIISNETFVGKDADEAVKLFIQVSKDTGYMVSGRIEAGENEVEVAISGDTQKAQNLFNEIKTTVNQALADLDIQGTITKAENLTKEYLQKLVTECAPYLDQAKVKAMEYDELLNEIAKSREETKGLFSQELKDAYYQAKADALKKAQLEEAKSKLDLISQATMTTLQTAYESALTTIESIRQGIFAENGVYYTALNDFNSAKTDYLKKRNELSQIDESLITQNMKTQLEDLDSAVQSAETALNNAYTTINNELDTYKATVDSKYNAIINTISSLKTTVEKGIDTTSETMKQAITDFTTSFETNYGTAKEKAKTRVDAMYNNLTTPAE